MRQGLVYHKEAYACVMADLVLPKGLWISERISNAKLGISIRMLKDHDIINDLSRVVGAVVKLAGRGPVGSAATQEPLRSRH